jgi:hypothetical protein
MEVTYLYDDNGVKYAALLCGKVAWFVSPEKYKAEQAKKAGRS